MLKNSSTKENETDLTTPVNTTTNKTYLCLALHTQPEIDCISGHKKVLGKPVKATKDKDPDAFVTHYGDEKSNGNIHTHVQRCIHLPDKFSSSIA